MILWGATTPTQMHRICPQPFTRRGRAEAPITSYDYPKLSSWARMQASKEREAIASPYWASIGSLRTAIPHTLYRLCMSNVSCESRDLYPRSSHGTASPHANSVAFPAPGSRLTHRATPKHVALIGTCRQRLRSSVRCVASIRCSAEALMPVAKVCNTRV